MAICGVAAQAGPHTLQRVEIARFERGLVASKQLGDPVSGFGAGGGASGGGLGGGGAGAVAAGAAGGAAGAGTGWCRSGAGGAGCGEGAGLVVGGGGASAAAGFSVFSGAGGAEDAARARTSRAVALVLCGDLGAAEQPAGFVELDGGVSGVPSW